jgi:hypothetical protein
VKAAVELEAVDDVGAHPTADAVGGFHDVEGDTDFVQAQGAAQAR